jgi:hypothetical protein
VTGTVAGPGVAPGNLARVGVDHAAIEIILGVGAGVTPFADVDVVALAGPGDDHDDRCVPALNRCSLQREYRERLGEGAAHSRFGTVVGILTRGVVGAYGFSPWRLQLGCDNTRALYRLIMTAVVSYR